MVVFMVFTEAPVDAGRRFHQTHGKALFLVIHDDELGALGVAITK
jgi:hypothetical protein